VSGVVTLAAGRAYGASIERLAGAVGAGASPGEFAAVESLLGGFFAWLAEILRDPVARIDTVGLTARRSGVVSGTGSAGFRSGRVPSLS
jgi:hypothetical protein